MENSRIIEIFDCSRDERKCIFSLAEKTAWQSVPYMRV
jgi:hypothetical protein